MSFGLEFSRRELPTMVALSFSLFLFNQLKVFTKWSGHVHFLFLFFFSDHTANRLFLLYINIIVIESPFLLQYHGGEGLWPTAGELACGER